ncbi:hypothetical protein C3L33_15172, partial [Rhododendron williamsianum]
MISGDKSAFYRCGFFGLQDTCGMSKADTTSSSALFKELLISSLVLVNLFMRYMLTFAEHECYGKGSNTSNRVKWEARLDRKS